jgi:hypothetical protein
LSVFTTDSNRNWVNHDSRYTPSTPSSMLNHVALLKWPAPPTQCWACVMVNYQKLFRRYSQHWTGGRGWQNLLCQCALTLHYLLQRSRGQGFWQDCSVFGTVSPINTGARTTVIRSQPRSQDLFWRGWFGPWDKWNQDRGYWRQKSMMFVNIFHAIFPTAKYTQYLCSHGPYR